MIRTDKLCLQPNLKAASRGNQPHAILYDGEKWQVLLRVWEANAVLVLVEFWQGLNRGKKALL